MIEKLPDGRFRGRVRLGRKPDGTFDRPFVYGKTRLEVQKQITKLSEDFNVGLRTDPTYDKQSVREFLDRWLSAARATTRPTTWAGYEQNVRLHIKPGLDPLGKRKLTKLRPDTIQQMYANCLQSGLSPSTVTKIHIVLHRALQMAVRWDYLPRNPADLVDRPFVPKRDMKALEPGDLNKLVAVAMARAQSTKAMSKTQARADHQWAVLWALAIKTGLREGELLALQWTDIDMDNGLIGVTRNLVKAKEQRPLYGEPKSTTSRRTVSIDAEMVRMLRAHKARQSEERLAAVDWAAFDLVFCSEIGTPLMRRNVLRAFKLALGRAGLPDVRFHDLRHAHATLLLRAGVALKTASARLGHSGIAITADLYQHVAGDLDADAAQKVADVLGDKVGVPGLVVK